MLKWSRQISPLFEDHLAALSRWWFRGPNHIVPGPHLHLGNRTQQYSELDSTLYHFRLRVKSIERIKKDQKIKRLRISSRCYFFANFILSAGNPVVRRGVEQPRDRQFQNELNQSILACSPFTASVNPSYQIKIWLCFCIKYFEIPQGRYFKSPCFSALLAGTQ